MVPVFKRRADTTGTPLVDGDRHGIPGTDADRSNINGNRKLHVKTMAALRLFTLSGMLVYLLIHASITGQVNGASCLDGWSMDSGGASCYKVDCTAIQGGKTAHNAACQAVNGAATGASVTTEAENEAVSAAITASACATEADGYWLGAEEGAANECRANVAANDCNKITNFDSRTPLPNSLAKFAPNDKTSAQKDCVAYKIDKTWEQARCENAQTEKKSVCRLASIPDPTNGGGDTKSSCLYGRDRVMTEAGGPKLVEELRAGDKVMSVGEDGRMFYDEVYVMAHADPDKAATFKYITTTRGDNVYMTAAHMILTHDGVEKTAERVVATDRVYVYDDVTGEVQGREVQDVREEVKTGVYNPITRSGRLMVNGVLVSAFPSMHDQLGARGMQTLMWPVRMMYNVYPEAVSAGRDAEGMPAWARYAFQVVSRITAA